MHERDRQTDGHRATAKTALMHICCVVKTGCWFVGDDDLTGALHDL